jgi:hypothetical protein
MSLSMEVLLQAHPLKWGNYELVLLVCVYHFNSWMYQYFEKFYQLKKDSFKCCWWTILPISTNRTTTSHSKHGISIWHLKSRSWLSTDVCLSNTEIFWLMWSDMYGNHKKMNLDLYFLTKLHCRLWPINWLINWHSMPT